MYNLTLFRNKMQKMDFGGFILGWILQYSWESELLILATPSEGLVETFCGNIPANLPAASLVPVGVSGSDLEGSGPSHHSFYYHIARDSDW